MKTIQEQIFMILKDRKIIKVFTHFDEAHDFVQANRKQKYVIKEKLLSYEHEDLRIL